VNIYYCSNGCGALDEAPVGRPIAKAHSQGGFKGFNQTNYHVCTISARQVAAVLAGIKEKPVLYCAEKQKAVPV